MYSLTCWNATLLQRCPWLKKNLCRIWEELHGDKRVGGGIFCFYFSSLMRQRCGLLCSQRLHCLVPRREQQDRQRGPFLQSGGEEGKKKNPQQSLYSAVLDLTSEQQLVIKLTSQQALGLALASHIIVVHWGGNSFFRGYQVKNQGWHRLIPAALALRDGESLGATVLVLQL